MSQPSPKKRKKTNDLLQRSEPSAVLRVIQSHKKRSESVFIQVTNTIQVNPLQQLFILLSVYLLVVPIQVRNASQFPEGSSDEEQDPFPNERRSPWPQKRFAANEHSKEQENRSHCQQSNAKNETASTNPRGCRQFEELLCFKVLDRIDCPSARPLASPSHFAREEEPLQFFSSI